MRGSYAVAISSCVTQHAVSCCCRVMYACVDSACVDICVHVLYTYMCARLLMHILIHAYLSTDV